jgi:phage shock protein PspC (stress-responsive transcriptional regulator)
MQRVVTINLNGNAYQVDERGYDALVAYLAHADQQLAGNPDRAEILADLEQAIADKCLKFLGPRKTVVTAAEVDQIVSEMGPVEGAPANAGAGAPGGASTTDGARPQGAPRRLYRITDGAMLGGVCAGLAAYLGIDATIVRVAFVVLTLLTKGFWALAYIVLLIVVPKADTSEERAAAHGEPFNARELIDRARRGFTGPRWHRAWRRERRAWRRQMRYATASRGWWDQGAVAVPPAGYAGRLLAGIMIPILAFLSAGWFWLFVFTAISLITKQDAFGITVGADTPIWLALLVVAVAYSVVTVPLHAMRRASYYSIAAAWDGLISLGFGVLIVWVAYRSFPEVQEMVHSLPFLWDSVRELIRQTQR